MVIKMLANFSTMYLRFQLKLTYSSTQTFMLKFLSEVSYSEQKGDEKHNISEQLFIFRSTHSPFMLGTLNAKIYDLDSRELEETKWTELENVRYFYDFFKRHREEFEQ